MTTFSIAFYPSNLTTTPAIDVTLFLDPTTQLLHVTFDSPAFFTAIPDHLFTGVTGQVGPTVFLGSLTPETGRYAPFPLQLCCSSPNK
jgi:hypothetical protein